MCHHLKTVTNSNHETGRYRRFYYAMPRNFYQSCLGSTLLSAQNCTNGGVVYFSSSSKLTHLSHLYEYICLFLLCHRRLSLILFLVFMYSRPCLAMASISPSRFFLFSLHHTHKRPHSICPGIHKCLTGLKEGTVLQ